MTKAEAKEISLEVWGYLAAHPECGIKSDMPPAIYDKIKGSDYECPLCDLFYEKNCSGCVLYESNEECDKPYSLFRLWKYAERGKLGNETREAAAKRIASIIEAWDTGEDA